MNLEKKSKRHREWLLEIIAWIEKNDRAPSRNENDNELSHEEITLARRSYAFRYFRKHNCPEWTDEFEELIQKHNLVLAFELPLIYNKYKKFEALLDWIMEYGRTPNQNGTLPNEREMGIQLTGLRQAYNGGNTKRVWYDEYTNIAKRKGLLYLFDAKSTEEKLIELLEWIKTNKSTPKFATAKDEYEKKLYYRLTNFKAVKNGMASTMVWKPEYNKLINKYKQQKHFMLQK